MDLQTIVNHNDVHNPPFAERFYHMHTQKINNKATQYW
jgi:hypothetical protein